jgi:hypothetical protein
MGDVFTVEGNKLVVQTLFDKHIFLTVEGDGKDSHLVAEHLAEFLNENGYHLPVHWNGDVYSIPPDYEERRAAAWASVDKPE